METIVRLNYYLHYIMYTVSTKNKAWNCDANIGPFAF